MIKVLHFVSSLSVSSGLMSVVMNYYRHIDRSKVQFGFMFFKKITEGSYEEEIKKLGGDCFFVDKPFFSKKYIKYIKTFFDNYCTEYSVFHLHELYLTRILLKALNRERFKMVIGHAHTTKFSDKLISSIRNHLLWIGSSKEFDVRLACSKDAGKSYFGNKPFKVLYNAVDIEKYRYSDESRYRIRKEFNINESTVVIGNVGRLCKQKNQSFLIKIFKFFKTKHIDSKLLIVGDGPLQKKLKKLAQKENVIEDTIFAGKRDDIGSLYSAMDIFVFPSLFEGLGIVLVEAQINGLACLASSIVPIEAKIIPSLNFLSLKKRPSIWANVLSTQRISDIDMYVVNSKYDIDSQSKCLEKIYLLKNNDMGVLL